MKTALTYWFIGLLILLGASFFMVSCKAKQPLQNTIIENKDKNTVSDSQEIITINQEILDRMLFNIAQINSSNPDCDSLINHYRHELAKSIATSKQSGDNSYEMKYNEALKRLEMLVKIGKTENKEKLTTINNTTTYTLQKTVEVPVHFMQWWEKMFMRIGQVCTGLALAFLLFFIIKSKIKTS